MPATHHGDLASHGEAALLVLFVGEHGGVGRERDDLARGLRAEHMGEFLDRIQALAASGAGTSIRRVEERPDKPDQPARSLQGRTERGGGTHRK